MKLDKPKKTSRPGADRRWTLLFIGDHGNVITLKRFKAIVVAAGCLLFLSLAFLTVLFFTHQKTLQKNKDLQKRFQNSQQQIETLRHEKEILMARLVLAGSKAKENLATNRRPKERSTAVVPVDVQPQEAAKSKPVSGPQQEPPGPQKRQPQPAESQTRDTEVVMRVAVENFRVSRESENKNLSAQFKIKNTSRGYQRVVGQAVVILKGADLEKDQWLVMPAVNLVGDKPSGKRGKSFSIQRFRTMIVTSKAPNHSDQFQTAAVYVFSKTGKLLLEQDFTIKLPALPVASSKPPSDDSSSREAQSAKAPTMQSAPREAPAGDDLLDSLDEAPPVF